MEGINAPGTFINFTYDVFTAEFDGVKKLNKNVTRSR